MRFPWSWSSQQLSIFADLESTPRREADNNIDSTIIAEMRTERLENDSRPLRDTLYKPARS